MTVLVTRRVRAGHEADFEQAANGMIAAATQFEGHLGGYLIKPDTPGGRLYQTLFAFDSDAHLRAWTTSAPRRAFLDRIAAISEGGDGLQILSGLETWFALPAARVRQPPPRYKMAVVTWMGIFPSVMAISALVAPWLAPIHPALSVLVVTALVTIAMTWAVMPALARLLAPWLYPAPADTPPRQ